MTSLADHLRDLDPLDYFPPEEMSNITLFVYGMLIAAVREDCDTIAFTTNEVTWSRGGLPVRQRWESPLQDVTFREMMRRIVARDPIVSQHLRLVRQEAAIDSYRIEYPALAAVAIGDGAARQAPTMR